MKPIEAVAVHSHSRPGGVSMRATDGMSVRGVLEAAGVEAGEKLLILRAQEVKQRISCLQGRAVNASNEATEAGMDGRLPAEEVAHLYSVAAENLHAAEELQRLLPEADA